MSENLKSAIELTCSEIQPGKLKAAFKVSKKSLASEANSVASEFSKFAQIPGFRVGKAPAQMVLKKYAPHVKEELTKRIMGLALDKFNEDQDAEAVAVNLPEGAAQPQLELGQDFSFEMEFDVAPKFELPDYKKIEVESKPVKVTKKQVEERIESHKKMYASYQDIEEAAQKEDMLKVSYTSDFELAEDAPVTLKRQVASDDNWVWLNEPEVIPGVIDALTGAEKDKEYEFTAEYPADHREPALAGKKVTYKMKVNNVQRRVPVKDIKELCEKMNIENEEKLNEQVEESLRLEAQNQADREKREQFIEELEKVVGDLVIPPTVLAQETQKELRHLANATVKSEEDAEAFKKDIDKHKAEAEDAAKAKLRRVFIMQRIAKAENISVDEAEIDQQIKGMSSYYGMKPNDLRKLMEDNGGLDDMHMDILIGKVTDFLVENSGK